MAQPALGEQRVIARGGSFKPLGIVTIEDEPRGLEMLSAIKFRAAAWRLREHEHFVVRRGYCCSSGSLPIPTWCRLRHQNSNGPKPVRNKAFPWGLPWLKEHERSQVDADNDALRSTLRLLNQVHTSRPRVNWHLLHPEGLGTAKWGTTASPWQLRELRQ